MFGYVTICEPELKVKDWRKYRAYYCGLCRTLRERHGSLGQITLSYDLTFAVILLTSLYEQEGKVSAHRCKVHPAKKQRMIQNEITAYCADMNIILCYYHLKDDWDDERKLSALAGAGALRRRAGKAALRYPRQSRAIQRELRALSACEAQNVQEIDIPAGCFGRLMGEILVYQEDVWGETLRRLGFFLGKFIYIMDAWEDLEKDMCEGNYNPLRAICARSDYEEACRQMMCMMAAEASAAFERLPCLWDGEILRNILYAGVWGKYNKLCAERQKG